MRVRYICFLLAALVALPGSAQDGLEGTFSDGNLTIALQAAGEGYRGVARMSGVRMPLEIVENGSQLSGAYLVNGQPYRLIGSLQGDVLTIQTVDGTYTLKRVEADSTTEAAPGEFVRKDDGFSIKMAGGFAFRGEEDGSLLFSSSTTPGLIAVRLDYALKQQDVQTASRSGYQEPGIALQPSGAPEDVPTPGGAGKRVEVEGVVQGSKAKGLLAGYVRGENGGLGMLIVTEPERWNDLREAAYAISSGVRFFKVEAGPIIAQWKSRLRGKKLLRMTSFGDYQGGGSSETTYFLCSDGSFAYKDKSGMTLDVSAGYAYQRSRDGGNGAWDVRPRGGDALVVFQFVDGNRHEYAITDPGGKIHLNGKRFFITSQNAVCR